MRSPNIIIAASGTGGHLLPAIQIAKSILKIDSKSNIVFLGAGRPLEAQLIDSQGFKRQVLSTVGVKNTGLRGAFIFLITLPRAILQVLGILRGFKPDVVVGVGGYVSVLPVLLAWICRIPTWIHEAEVKAGMANGLLSYFASKVSVAFSNAQLPCMSNVVYTGHPIRQDLLAVVKPAQAGREPKNLLVLGGSQGANAVDQALVTLAPFLHDQNLEVFHQCRKENIDQVKLAYASSDLKAEVLTFVDDISAAYHWADLVICRSGAGTVMEIEAINLPCIFVPYPFSQGAHQVANARFLVDRNKALLVEEGEGFVERLREALSKLLDLKFYESVISSPVEKRSLKASESIAKGILSLAEQKIK